MKRYVKSSSDDDYPIIIHTMHDVDEDKLKSEIRRILAPASRYISQVELNLGTMLQKGSDMRVKSNQRVAQLYVKTPTKNPELAFSGLLRYATSRLDAFIELNEKKMSAKQHGSRILSALSVVKQLVQKRFGYKPAFVYSDTGKLVYPLYEFSFADNDNRSINRKQGELAADEMDEFLEEISDMYDIDLDWDLPLGGNYVRAAWIIYVYKDNNLFTYNKEANEYIPESI